MTKALSVATVLATLLVTGCGGGLAGTSDLPEPCQEMLAYERQMKEEASDGLADEELEVNKSLKLYEFASACEDAGGAPWELLE